MKVFRSLAAWKEEGLRLKNHSSTLGFVPTMGALHSGHLSLVQKAKRDNDLTLVSIFVNPTQFNDKKDFDKYPIHTTADLALLENEGVDYVLLPEYDELYADHYELRVTENAFSRELCGAFRPEHFDGVLSVVLKLLNIAKADRAYFGEKDYQQYLLIKKMCDAFFLPTEILPCPTLREPNGLAMSSRNERLTTDERQLASAIYEQLTSNHGDLEIFKNLTRKKFRVDYVKSTQGRRFIAAHLGPVRLIDNIPSTFVDQPKAKRILITSGATREYLDSVRFISNISSGKTGAVIAEYFARWGYPVTYLHGQGTTLPELSTGPIETIGYSNFDSLNSSLAQLLSQHPFDVIIHSAAVSDFGIKEVNGAAPSLQQKIKSQDSLNLLFKTHEKIVNNLKRYSLQKDLFVVAFKLTASGDLQDQQNRIQKIEQQAAPDLLVHNDLNEISALNHQGSILEKGVLIANFDTKDQLAAELFKAMALKEIL